MGESVNVVRFVHDKYTDRAAGYCFVELDSGDACRRCMLNINGKVRSFLCFLIVFSAQVIPKSRSSTAFHLSFASTPSSPYTEHNIFVFDLHEDVEDDKLFRVNRALERRKHLIFPALRRTVPVVPRRESTPRGGRHVKTHGTCTLQRPDQTTSGLRRA